VVEAKEKAGISAKHYWLKHQCRMHSIAASGVGDFWSRPHVNGLHRCCWNWEKEKTCFLGNFLCTVESSEKAK